MEQSNHKSDLEILSHNLRWLRRQYRYSQKEMAVILKIGIGSLSKLERGEIPPRLSVDFLFAAYDHFRIKPSVLLSVWME